MASIMDDESLSSSVLAWSAEVREMSSVGLRSDIYLRYCSIDLSVNCLSLIAIVGLMTLVGGLPGGSQRTESQIG